ncbi:hypothetical protein ACIA5C_20430 [Actinoplanes sp. NPDC051343]|uniref:hypothetical protein n=1 Tax=Actinoplanes sp. NPDC051343 TaxID=3363906 RepID=UPI0037B8BE92
MAVLAGSIVSTRFALSARVRALVQHAAAGTVLAGLVVDVLDKLLHRAGQLVAAVAAVAGMVAGLVAMLAIRAWADGAGVGTFVVTAAVDILVDGVLIGLSAALGAGTGLLFAVALATEMGLLGVSAAAALRKRRPSGRVVAAAAGIGAAIRAAGSLGWVIAQSGSFAATAVLGLGASVIIYVGSRGATSGSARD